MSITRFPNGGGLRTGGGTPAIPPVEIPSSSRLVQAYTPAGTVLQVDRVLNIQANLYVGVDVGTVNCEIATVQSVAGEQITLTGALNLAHPVGASVQAVVGSEVPSWWWGIRSDRVTDDTAGWQQACSGQTATRSLWINGAGNLNVRGSFVSQPIVRADGTRLRNVTILPGLTSAGDAFQFAPMDCSNAVLMSQNHSPNTLTFTASAGTVTTSAAHGIGNNNMVMLKKTTGLAGAVEGRVYYVASHTTTTLTLASCLAQSNAGVSDVTITAGSGTIYLEVMAEGRQYYEDVYVLGRFGPGINGIIDNIQQPGYADKPRIDNCVAVWGLLTTAASSFAAVDQYYVVVGFDSAGNPWRTAQVSMTATNGNQPGPTKQVILSWGSLTGVVPGNITWSVYRASTSGTHSTVDSLIASGLTGTTFTDDGSAVASGMAPDFQRVSLNSVSAVTAASSFDGTTRYWRVAAVDGSGRILVSNEMSLAPTSAQTAKLIWFGYPGAASYNIYRASAPNGQATSPALVANVASTVTTYTDTGTAVGAGSCVIPAQVHPGGFGLYVHGQQFVYRNFESIQCDTAVKCGVGEMLYFFGFDAETCALRAMHAVPLAQHLTDLTALGIFNCIISGAHHEMPGNYIACYDFEANVNKIIIDSPEWSSGGGTSGVGGGKGAAFIYQHANSGGGLINSGYQLRSMTMTTPSSAGTLLIGDQDRQQFLDTWTQFTQRGPAEIIVPAAANGTQTPCMILRPGGGYIAFGSHTTTDPQFQIKPGTAQGGSQTQSGPQFTTGDQATGGSSVQVTAAGQLKFASATFEATGAKTATLGANGPMVTTTPYTWEKILSSDGSTVFFPVWK